MWNTSSTKIFRNISSYTWKINLQKLPKFCRRRVCTIIPHYPVDNDTCMGLHYLVAESNSQMFWLAVVKLQMHLSNWSCLMICYRAMSVSISYQLLLLTIICYITLLTSFLSMLFVKTPDIIRKLDGFLKSSWNQKVYWCFHRKLKGSNGKKCNIVDMNCICGNSHVQNTICLIISSRKGLMWKST